MQMLSRNCDLTGRGEPWYATGTIGDGPIVDSGEQAMSMHKHGGLWFVRIGRISISFCVVRNRKVIRDAWANPVSDALEMDIARVVSAEFAGRAR